MNCLRITPVKLEPMDARAQTSEVELNRQVGRTFPRYRCPIDTCLQKGRPSTLILEDAIDDCPSSRVREGTDILADLVLGFLEVSEALTGFEVDIHALVCMVIHE